jgi:hypothetical protein
VLELVALLVVLAIDSSQVHLLSCLIVHLREIHVLVGPRRHVFIHMAIDDSVKLATRRESWTDEITLALARPRLLEQIEGIGIAIGRRLLIAILNKVRGFR